MSRMLMRAYNQNNVSPDTLRPPTVYEYTDGDTNSETLLGIVEHIYFGAIRAALTSQDRSYTHSVSHCGASFKNKDYDTILACIQEYFEDCLVEYDDVARDHIVIDWS